jgi:hypothetical protein
MLGKRPAAETMGSKGANARANRAVPRDRLAASNCDLSALQGLTRMSWGTDWYWDDGLMPGLPAGWGQCKEVLR